MLQVQASFISLLFHWILIPLIAQREPSYKGLLASRDTSLTILVQLTFPTTEIFTHRDKFRILPSLHSRWRTLLVK